MFTLIKNANLYSPEHLGMNDVLLADDKIALIDRKIELTGIPFDTIDAVHKSYQVIGYYPSVCVD